MQIIHGIDSFNSLQQKEIILALGNFDGVHIGHQEIISNTVSLARQQHKKSAVLIFLPHPLTVLHPDCSPGLVITVEDRTRMLCEAGVDYVILHPFDKEFAVITPARFAHEILAAKLHAATVVVGYDYSFGHRGDGKTDDLKAFGRELGFIVKVIPPITAEGKPVGSSTIRRLLAAGRVQQANVMLGYTYFLRGQVIHGDGRGHLLGFPTANLLISPEVMHPANGVYLTQAVTSNDTFWALTNVGSRPTFGKKDISVEVHLLDTKKNLYSKELIVRFLHRMREEKSFTNVDSLIAQIKHDVLAAKQLIKCEYP